MRTLFCLPLLWLPLALCTAAEDADSIFWARLETGALWFSKNDARVPGDGGDQVDLRSLTGSGPDAYIRAMLTYQLTTRHSLTATYAPVSSSGTGHLDQARRFRNTVFAAHTPTTAEYTFNTYRLTFSWRPERTGAWRWGIGATVLLRDAHIQLEQPGIREVETDLGVVPLLHLSSEWALGANWYVIADVDGAWSPQGRAVDFSVAAEYRHPAGWLGGVGYRSLEGGADNDTVYTFAWLHQAFVRFGYEF